jgi:hypothetical protein
MNTREAENNMLMRCHMAARDASVAAQDQQEANVFRLAAMVIQSCFPDESAKLMDASDAYFSCHPNDRLPAVEVVRKGLVFSLPRLRDMLSLKLRGR